MPNFIHWEWMARSNFINSDAFPANLTQIIPGNFSGKKTTDLLFYNAKAGQASFSPLIKVKFICSGTRLSGTAIDKQILPAPAPYPALITAPACHRA